MQIRYLLLGLLAISVFVAGRAAGWLSNRHSRVDSQRSIRALVDQLGGHAYFDYQLIKDENERLADDDGRDSRPSWLAKIVGRDWLHDIFYISFAQFQSIQKDGAVAARREEIGDQQIEQLVPLTGLKWLALSGTAVTDKGVEQLASLPNLERLWLSQTAVTDQGLQHLASCTSLTHLAIEGTPTSDRGLAAVVKLPHLKFLSVGSPYITANGLRALADAKSLEELRLDRLPVDNRVMQSIGRLGNLSQLSLRATPVTNQGLRELRQLSRLTQVWLDGTLITDGALEVASNWPELFELSITRTAISDAGLAHLENCTKLRSLKLSETACSLSGILDLFTCKQSHSISEAFQIVFDTRLNELDLASIDLSGTRVTDADVPHFASFTKLQWLRLPDNELSDVGVRAIADLKLPSLSLLNINGARITDQGLVELSKIPSLRDLHVAGTGVSSEAVAALQRTIPSLRVYNQELRKNRS